MKLLCAERLNGQFEINTNFQATFGAKSIRCLGPKLWNSLPFQIKSSESLTTLPPLENYKFQDYKFCLQTVR